VPDEIALDTTVLRLANVRLDGTRAQAARMAARLSLLRRIRDKEMRLLVSRFLIHEYCCQVSVGQNDFVKAFLELLTRPDGTYVIINWKNRWSGGERHRARKCRYPSEDYHVLRTAFRPHPTVIYTEEDRMLRADACIYRAFGVHIREP
jgi:hypothetical protein